MVRIELTASPLPRECSTTELHKREIALHVAILVVGRGGFEPPYTYVNRFTVCRL